MEITIQTPAGGALVFPEPAPLVRWFVSGNSGGYDGWAKVTPPNRITAEDISALNRFARARTPERHWAGVIADRRCLWLKALSPEWDAAATSEEEWAAQDVSARLEAAFAVLCGPYRGISVASKLLHLKRPRLIPLLDALVLEQLGVPVPGGKRRWRPCRSRGRADDAPRGAGTGESGRIVRAPVRAGRRGGRPLGDPPHRHPALGLPSRGRAAPTGRAARALALNPP